MPMFDYGKNKSESEQTYRYQYLTPTIQAGFYPVDNLLSVNQYEAPVMSDYGVHVYGELAYSQPLTESQCTTYEFLEITPLSKVGVIKQSDVKAVDEQAIADVSSLDSNPVQADETDNMVYLQNVRANRLFDSKNPDYKIISMKDSRSDTGYVNFVVQTKNIKQNENGTYDVGLGKAGSTQNMSLVQNGEKSYITTSVGDIKAQFEQTLMSPKSNNYSKGNAYLNMVDSKFVRATKNPDYKVVSVPYQGSENGYAKITVSRSNIFDTKVNGKTVPNHVNVNLGPSNKTIPVSIKKDGKFTQEFMEVNKLSELQKRAVDSWSKYSTQKSEEIAEQSKDTVPEFDEVFS